MLRIAAIRRAAGEDRVIMPRSIYAREKVVPLAGSLWERGDRAWDRGHLSEAERLFGLAAAMGEATAMDSLATLLDELKRPEEAVHWYKRSVASGNEMSAWNLAMHYIPIKQQRLYRYWMLKSAAMGHEDAIVEATKIKIDPKYMTRLPLEQID